jgi:PAS domain S-box-containing protein
MDKNHGPIELFEYATEGILIANGNGKILKINPSAEKMFGYQRGELKGSIIETLIPARFAEKHTKHREAYGRDPYPKLMGKGRDLYGKRKDGSEFPIEISLSNYTSDGDNYVIGFIVDITERKLAEQKLTQYSMELEKRVNDRTMMLREVIGELERSKDEINNALKKEKELNDLKTRFVSMASHEFRTPLSTILSSVALISKYNSQADEEKRNKHISRIKSSVNHLTDVLNDFLSISKLEEGMVNIVPVELDMPKFCEEIIQEMQAVSKDKQEIEYLHETEECTVFIDNKVLRNILINLISNAIKFSEEGKTIYVLTSLSDDALRISVRDQGIGISEKDQQHLFKRFFRGQNVTNIQGTGLGLNIVSKYVELLGGTINYKSELGKGSEFILNFKISTKKDIHENSSIN